MSLLPHLMIGAHMPDTTADKLSQMDLQKLRHESLDPKLAAQLAPFVIANRPHERAFTRSELKDNNKLDKAKSRVSHVNHKSLVRQSTQFRTVWLPDLEVEE